MYKWRLAMRNDYDRLREHPEEASPQSMYYQIGYDSGQIITRDLLIALRTLMELSKNQRRSDEWISGPFRAWTIRDPKALDVGQRAFYNALVRAEDEAE